MQNIIELGFLKILFLHISGIFLEFFLGFFLSQKTAVSKSVRQGLGNINSLFPFLLVCFMRMPGSHAFCQQDC